MSDEEVLLLQRRLVFLSKAIEIAQAELEGPAPDGYSKVALAIKVYRARARKQEMERHLSNLANARH